ncbi:coenzyme F420-0:L-glutamate ligase [Kineosporia sp. R_H_3]|uniref:coenzyme F420-0:L-glutamate ligase n=1 Tax=Kineosporia sp. R_H_3 TaxID=1961848 RepID=UPI000B4B8F35|nr:coenzyme F420-0:L-glutamate ligase [Kineosporia sp. R_H_3]
MTVLEIHPVHGLPEVAAGDDLAALVVATGTDLRDGDVLVVASKVVAKAEGRTVAAASRDGAVAAQTLRVVAERRTPRGTTRIVESRSGPVMAAAGVDASNVALGTVLLLPADPDGSARALRAGLRARTGLRLAVVVTDTLGRPWRDGQVDAAIGAAGLAVTDDLRGATDAYGNPLEVTVRAVADEVASAADLVKGKLEGVPVAVVRGLAGLVQDDDGPGAATLLRAGAGDWFRLGHVEAVRTALGAPPAHDVEPPHVVREDVATLARRAVRLALRHRLVGAALAVAADVTTELEPDGSRHALVTLRADDRFALGAVAERLGAAAWAEDLVATVLEEGPRHVVLRLAPA